MNIHLSGHHIEITESLQVYVNDKMAKLSRHIDNLNSAHVILRLDNQHKEAEGSVHMLGQDLHASAQNDDMYTAIDQMVEKLDRQALKLKEKSTDRLHGQG